MAYGIPEDAEYGYIKERLLRVVDLEQRHGHPLAATDAGILADHDTETRRRGDPCRACTQPWPCSTVMGILGRD